MIDHFDAYTASCQTPFPICQEALHVAPAPPEGVHMPYHEASGGGLMFTLQILLQCSVFTAPNHGLDYLNHYIPSRKLGVWWMCFLTSRPQPCLNLNLLGKRIPASERTEIKKTGRIRPFPEPDTDMTCQTSKHTASDSSQTQTLHIFHKLARLTVRQYGIMSWRPSVRLIGPLKQCLQK